MLEDVQVAITDRPARYDEAVGYLKEVQTSLERFFASEQEHDGAEAEHNEAEAIESHRLTQKLAGLINVIQADPQHRDAQDLMNRVGGLRGDVMTLGHGANELVDAALVRTRRHAVIARTTLVSLCLIGAVFGLLLAYLQYRWVLRPVVSLRDRVRRAVEARGVEASSTDGSDPVSELGSGFDGLLVELSGLYGSLEARVNQKSRELIISERLASVGYLAAGVAHEINNPLNTILGYTELTLRDLAGESDQQAVQSLTVVREETLRCKHIVEKLLSLVRKSDAPREAVELRDVVRDVVAIVNGLKQFRGRTIEAELPGELGPMVVSAREAELKQVLLNLLINAIEALPAEGGVVQLQAKREAGFVRVAVIDNGQGMDAQTLGRIFEPFFTRKRGSQASGTGLGLSVVFAIVQEHGGRIRAESGGAGRGSRFILELPAAD